MVMDTIGCGSGFYFTRGGMCDIKWFVSEDGTMTFTTLDGIKLVVNRGKIYISFVKSSMIGNVSFE